MALFRQFCSLEKANSSRKTNVYRCLTCGKDPGYYSSRFNEQFSPSLRNSGALLFCASTKKVYRFLPPRGLKLWLFWDREEEKEEENEFSTSVEEITLFDRPIRGRVTQQLGDPSRAGHGSGPWSVGYHLSSCNASDRTRTCWPTLCG